ncbi:MAG: tRNA preQ1(34) S-adenosylmethionine ribosyltransferase-isomerase QueA [Dehalococcoidales bacterium]
MRTDDFDYHLPPGLIAQTPIASRDQSRLLVARRADGSLTDHRFSELADFLREGDVLVLNDSRVIPARLRARRVASGGSIEVLLLRRLDDDIWETLVRPARRIRVGEVVELVDGVGEPGLGVTGEIVGVGERGIRLIRFPSGAPLAGIGSVALPPYIHVPLSDSERYQTVYARPEGSVAAPTAGLHFTSGLLETIAAKGVVCRFVTLHVGLDTFRPVEEANPTEHAIHREYGIVTAEVAGELTRARQEGRRIVCVGTTSVRVVEAAAQVGPPDRLSALDGWVNLFILPGHRFRMVDAMVTNFHLPRSTLLMLVAAFAGRDFILAAYRQAAARDYRFYSFGDAMLIL